MQSGRNVRYRTEPIVETPPYSLRLITTSDGDAIASGASATFAPGPA